MLAAMPCVSSVGWLGCRRVDSRPGSPSVLRKRVTTRHLRGHQRSGPALRMILRDGGRHLGRDPGRERGSASASAVGESSHSRNSPTVRLRDGRESRRVVRVDDQARHLVGLVRDDGILEKRRQRHVGERDLRRRPLDLAALPRPRRGRRPSAGARPWRAARAATRRHAWCHRPRSRRSWALLPQPTPSTSLGRVSDSAGMKVVSSTTGKYANRTNTSVGLSIGPSGVLPIRAPK